MMPFLTIINPRQLDIKRDNLDFLSYPLHLTFAKTSATLKVFL